MSNTKRFTTLDYARGLAAFAVVFFHRGTYPTFSIFFNDVIKRGEVGVQIFFVISGYVIYQLAERFSLLQFPNSVFSFLKNRFKRIYPALWASLLFAFPVSIFIGKQTYGFGDVITSFTLTYNLLGFKTAQGVYWTLDFEQQFYILMTILILPLFSKTRIWLILSSSLVAVAVTLGIVSNHWVNSMLPAHWLEFALGMVVFFALQKKVSVSRWVSLPVWGLLFISGLLGSYRTQTASVFSLLILALFPVDHKIDSWKILKPLRYLGLISYSLYLVHLPTFALVDLLLKPYLSENSLLLYFIGITCALLVASLFYYFFERPFISGAQKKIVKTNNTENVPI